MKENLLLLHGALGSEKQFRTIKEGLEDSFEVYTMNFEGHGGHKTSKEFSIQLFAENVIDFIGKKSLNSINIFGHSMGGYVALNAALTVPTKIKKVLTLGTKFNWNLKSAEQEVKMLNPSIIEQKVPAFAETLKQEHYPQDWKSIMDKTAKMMLELGKGNKLTEGDFKKISQDVVIGIGSLDNIVSYEESKHASNLLPNSKLIKLDGIEHPIAKIRPEDLIDYIKINL